MEPHCMIWYIEAPCMDFCNIYQDIDTKFVRHILEKIKIEYLVMF